MTAFRLSFNGIIYEVQANALRSRIVQILERQDCESLTVLFASEGGNTDQSLSLYNFIRSLPVPIHIHAVGHVGSASIPVFVSGHKRTCTPHSRFFFHAYDWGFEGRQMTDRIAEALQRLDSDIKLARQIVEQHTNIPADKLDALYRRVPTPMLVMPNEAKKFGIVEEVVELNPKGIPEPDVVMWTVDW